MRVSVKWFNLTGLFSCDALGSWSHLRNVSPNSIRIDGMEGVERDLIFIIDETEMTIDKTETITANNGAGLRFFMVQLLWFVV